MAPYLVVANVQQIEYTITATIIQLHGNGEGVFVKEREKLIDRITRKPAPKDFTKSELDTLMNQCGCQKSPGGRGSAISYTHIATKRILRFDGPHPGNELYGYQIRMVLDFLKEIGEI